MSDLVYLSKLINANLLFAKDILDHKLIQSLGQVGPLYALMKQGEHDYTDVLAIRPIAPADFGSCGKDLFIRGNKFI